MWFPYAVFLSFIALIGSIMVGVPLYVILTALLCAYYIYAEYTYYRDDED